ESLHPVRVHMHQPHDALRVEDKRPGHWELPRLVAVEFWKGVPDALLHLAQRLTERKDEAVFACYAIAGIGQHREGQLLLLDVRPCEIRGLRRDRDKLRSEPADFGEHSLVAPQLQVAERTPRATVEGDNHRASCEQRGQGNLSAARIWQYEVGCSSADRRGE